MNIVSQAVAGTLESNDVLVQVGPSPGGIQLEVDSIVLNQFEDQIRQAVLDTARELGVQNARIALNDRGALECTIKARVETALRRAGEVSP